MWWVGRWGEVVLYEHEIWCLLPSWPFQQDKQHYMPRKSQAIVYFVLSKIENMKQQTLEVQSLPFYEDQVLHLAQYYSVLFHVKALLWKIRLECDEREKTYVWAIDFSKSNKVSILVCGSPTSAYELLFPTLDHERRTWDNCMYEGVEPGNI